MTNQIVVEVTEADWLAGIEACDVQKLRPSKNCPLAQALKRVVPGFDHCVANSAMVQHKLIALPSEPARIVNAFDSRHSEFCRVAKPAFPVTFTLSLA